MDQLVLVLKKKGYAAIFTRGTAALPTVIRTIKKRRRMITSSYDEEKAALTSRLEYLDMYYHHDDKGLICTDNQSCVEVLKTVQQKQPEF